MIEKGTRARGRGYLRISNPLSAILVRHILEFCFEIFELQFDGSGLNVLEPAEMPEKEVQAGEIVSLAGWSDETLTSLRPHEPEPTGVVVVLESRH